MWWFCRGSAGRDPSIGRGEIWPVAAGCPMSLVSFLVQLATATVLLNEATNRRLWTLSF
jgi:hypothetical protein